MSKFPIYISGTVEHGFKRGGKLLGCPTANLSIKETESIIKQLECGVYYGFCTIDNKNIYKTVTNIGWNPTFGDNEHKITECHLLHQFDEDFYGEKLKLIIVGFIRKEKKFSGFEELKNQIKNDTNYTDQILDDLIYQKYYKDTFFN